jgi:hypothetical protein
MLLEVFHRKDAKADMPARVPSFLFFLCVLRGRAHLPAFVVRIAVSIVINTQEGDQSFFPLN